MSDSFYHGNIEKQTEKNTFYRKVIFTTKNMQLVLMSIPAGEEIGMERHKGLSQFIRVEKGKGMAIIGHSKRKLKDGYAIIIPPGRRHNIINTGSRPLKLYSIYSPPQHPRNRKEKTKTNNH
jgi:mannose-6-phosphate isomerase-like protein (cupin superfamily)